MEWHWFPLRAPRIIRRLVVAFTDWSALKSWPLDCGCWLPVSSLDVSDAFEFFGLDSEEISLFGVPLILSHLLQ